MSEERVGAVSLLTKAQRDVLEWLVAYPGVEIQWVPLGNRPSWTSSWASEEWRQHMVGVMAVLGADATDSQPRARPLGGTPRLTTQTFYALLRRGMVHRVRYRPSQGVWSPMGYFQISRKGIAALREAKGPVLLEGRLA